MSLILFRTDELVTGTVFALEPCRFHQSVSHLEAIGSAILQDHDLFGGEDMSPAILGMTKAEDLMQRNVVALGLRDSLQDAILLMSEHHISGLPIVDGKNHCVGIVSSSDILSFVESEQEEAAGTVDTTGRYFNSESGQWEAVALSPALMEEYGSTPMEDVMTSDVLSVGPETPAEDVAALMIEHSVHRVLVLDGAQELLGVISAFDFVRIAAQGVDT